MEFGRANGMAEEGVREWFGEANVLGQRLQQPRAEVFRGGVRAERGRAGRPRR